MVGPVDSLFVLEGFDGLVVLAVGQPHQDVGQAQAHVARVLALPERLPLGVFGAVENLRHITRCVDIGEAVHVEHFRRRRRQQRRVGRGGHLRNLFEQLDVFRVPAKLVVADQRAERSPAEDAVLLLVDLLEQRALVELRRALQVAQQFLLGDVDHADLQLVAGLALIHQVLQAAPAPLQFLELLGVQNLVELNRNQMIDLGDARVDHRLGVFGDRDRPFEHLADELFDQVPAALLARGIAPHAPLLDDLVEQAVFRLLLWRRGGTLGLGIRHWTLPFRLRFRPSIWPASRCC